MLIQKGIQDTHKHDYYRAYKLVLRNKERRYLLMWKCRSCPLVETYDLVKEKPRG